MHHGKTRPRKYLRTWLAADGPGFIVQSIRWQQRPLREPRQHLPSVPSSSGKPLNGGFQKARSGAAFRRGFEEPPETVHSNGAPFGSVAAVTYRKSPCPMRACVAVEEGPGVLGPKELLQKGTCMPPEALQAARQECVPRGSTVNVHFTRPPPHRSPRSCVAGPEDRSTSAAW